MRPSRSRPPLRRTRVRPPVRLRDPTTCPDGEECPAVRRSYKFLLRPTTQQEAALSPSREDPRQLYNAALEERRAAWRMGRHRVSFYSQDAQLKEIRAED